MRNRPQQKRSQEKLATALGCAQKIMLRDGIEAVNTTRVAEEAGIAIGSLYRFFKDRNELLLALADEVIQDVLEEVAGELEMLPEDMPVDQVCRKLIEIYWASVRKRPGYRTLNRWQNAHLSIWETTPGTDSRMGQMAAILLTRAGIDADRADFAAIQQTALTLTSTLIDQILEQTDETRADQLKEELVAALTVYVNSRV